MGAIWVLWLFFSMGEHDPVQVEIIKAETFVGIAKSSTQGSEHSWQYLCEHMKGCFPRCRIKVKEPDVYRTVLDPYFHWWDLFSRNMHTVYSEVPTPAQINAFQPNNVVWHVLWLHMFDVECHPKYALKSDGTIIRKCFLAYCHSLCRHWDIWLRLYGSMYPFIQQGVENAHRDTRKDFNALRSSGCVKAAKHCIVVNELDRALQRIGRM